MLRHALSVSAAALICGLVTFPSVAGEAGDRAAAAEASAASGDHGAAIDSMREGLLALWAQSPLSFATVTYVSEDPGGYGLYKPRADNVFAADETLLIYAEPIGYGHEQIGEHFRTEMTVDFEVRKPDGTVLARQDEFGRFTFVSLAQNTEYMARVSISLTGAAPGEYVLGLIFHDRVDGDEASVDLPFEIR